MEAFKVKNLNFKYPGAEEDTLKNVSFSVESGSFVCLCGKSGCGKSTLLRNFKTTLMPYGEKSGEIVFFGRELSQISQRTQAESIGYVLQNPDNQIVTDKVWHELAFGLENLGYDNETIRVRVSEMASFFGIQTWFDRNVSTLSGGQKQLLNLASVMVMQPDVLILDEPTSQLDPIAASDFLDTVKKVNREIGTTVIITEHRLEEVFPIADKVVVMEHGEVILEDNPAVVAEKLAELGNPMYLAMPAPFQAYWETKKLMPQAEGETPLDVRGGRRWLEGIFARRRIYLNEYKATDKATELSRDKAKVKVGLKEVWFRYGRDEKDVVKDLNLEVYDGETFAIVGGNGTGKTTTLTLISGINIPYRGKITLNGKALDKYGKDELFSGMLGVLPQNPQAIFVEKTIRLDLMEMLDKKDISKETKAREIQRVAELVEIEHLLEHHPYDVSGGEQQRAALAKILLLNPKLLLLDEPTKGLDNHFKIKLAEILKRLKAEEGVTVIMVSHDIEFCSKYADRCAMFFDGGITSINTPREFFSGNSFYTTAANRMSRKIFKNAVTSKDVSELVYENFTKEEEGSSEDDDDPDNGGESRYYTEGPKIYEFREKEKPLRKLRENKVFRIAMSLFIGLLMGVTLAMGIKFGGHNTYFLVSLLICIYIMVPFFASFERKSSQIRKLVVMAVLIAIGVAGRQAFFMIPQFKPVLAIAIIAGATLGSNAGFIVGAMIAFVSNFFAGQGPWTPWQMLALGTVGFIGGLIFCHGRRAENKIAICAFGLLSGYIYGLIVDLWTIFGFYQDASWTSIATIYGAAVWYNTILAVATVIFLWILAKPLIDKIERIKFKYGIDV